ncbi:MAG: hypothetical protein HKO59_14075 [Phycisphaerales bacterium]|nr:hypothetical protein [Phycisphaerae bacterium]NNF42857.1 hypothetical protein [Phycisphaerales bacterium]NNM27088.1 hypothetical protein [Phycisphaerales bacterium]
MTHAAVPTTDDPTPLPVDRSLEFRWSALRADEAGKPRRSELVIAVNPVDADHCVFEAWLEGPCGVRTVLPRQPVACRRGCHAGLVHVDAEPDGRRLLRATFRPQTPGRPLYAQTTLLATAGLAPGAYDPPTARIIDAKRGVASA